MIMVWKGLSLLVAGRQCRSKKDIEHCIAFMFFQIPCPDPMCHASFSHSIRATPIPVEAFLWISKPTANNQTHWEQARGLSQGNSLLSSLTGHKSFDLSCSQMSLTTMVANYPVCTELLAWHGSIPHLSTKLHKLFHPGELFGLPGKFKPLISC